MAIPLFAADVSVSGAVDLTISTATAGEQPVSVADESSTLQWTTQMADPTKKITVQTSVVGANFTLTVQAVGVSPGDGTSLGVVTIVTAARDFINGIPAGIDAGSPGSCTLRYSASAAAANGTGTDTHTITYTIVDQ